MWYTQTRTEWTVSLCLMVVRLYSYKQSMFIDQCATLKERDYLLHLSYFFLSSFLHSCEELLELHGRLMSKKQLMLQEELMFKFSTMMQQLGPLLEKSDNVSGSVSTTETKLEFPFAAFCYQRWRKFGDRIFLTFSYTIIAGANSPFSWVHSSCYKLYKGAGNSPILEIYCPLLGES